MLQKKVCKSLLLLLLLSPLPNTTKCSHMHLTSVQVECLLDSPARVHNTWCASYAGSVEDDTLLPLANVQTHKAAGSRLAAPQLQQPHAADSNGGCTAKLPEEPRSCKVHLLWKQGCCIETTCIHEHDEEGGVHPMFSHQLHSCSVFLFEQRRIQAAPLKLEFPP